MLVYFLKLTKCYFLCKFTQVRPINAKLVLFFMGINMMKMLKITALVVALSASLALTAHAETPIKHDGVAALVNNQIILKSELEAAMLALSRQDNELSPAMLKKEALDLLILRKLQLGIVDRAGISPNERLVNQRLLDIAKSQGLTSLAELQKKLDAKKEGTYAALRANIIEEASIATLWQAQLANRVKVSQQEIDAFLASPEGRSVNTEEYHTWHFRVPFLDDVSRLSDSQRTDAINTANRLINNLKAGDTLETAMNRARGNYPKDIQGADTGYNRVGGLPSEISSVITSLTKGAVSRPIITETGVEVVKLIDKKNQNAVVIPEWQTSHILVKVDIAQSDTIAEQKINDIYRALQQGASFNALAATYSDDKASASQEGALGWVAEGQMVPEFEAVMKRTYRGDFSAPFKSQFGYHILKITDTRQRDVTNEYKRAYAEEVLFNRLAPQAGEDWLQELKSAAYIKVME